MMDLKHFANLHGRARTRKAALLLERIERSWAGGIFFPEDIDASHSSSSLSADVNRDVEFARDLAEFLAMSEESSDEVANAAREFLVRVSSANFGTVRSALNSFRHRLMVISGQSPADWDFIASTRPGRASLHRASGMRIYLEDIRSPFNVGSIFRTAEALGFEEIILSPDCADPLHPRALRTAMGTVERMQWRRAALSELDIMENVFALEVGGTLLEDFDFPRSGTMVLGSEELGVSSEALRHCSKGVVEIPLTGAKASLNVATAFGIAGYTWLSSQNSRSSD